MLSGFLKMQPALLATGCVVRRFSCDSRHPVESAKICRPRRISNFPQLHACACSDLGPVDLDFVEIAAVRVNHHATNPTIADKKIRASTHHEKWEVFIPAKSNQCGKRIPALGTDQILRRATD